MQADWSRYGPEAFEIRFLHVSIDELYWLEQVVIHHNNSLEEQGGYNKALGRLRTLAARIRDSETKLQRKAKFVLLELVSPHARIDATLARTFVQGECRLSDATKKIEEAVAIDPGIADELLASFEDITVDELIRRKKKLH